MAPIVFFGRYGVTVHCLCPTPVLIGLGISQVSHVLLLYRPVSRKQRHKQPDGQASDVLNTLYAEGLRHIELDEDCRAYLKSAPDNVQVKVSTTSSIRPPLCCKGAAILLRLPLKLALVCRL